MARSAANQLARIHALWTLEGLDSLDAGARPRADEEPGSADPDPGDPRQRDAVQGEGQVVRRRLQGDDWRTATPNVVIQAMLTLNLHKIPDYDKMIRATCRERDGARRPGNRRPDPAAARRRWGSGRRSPTRRSSGLNFSTDQRRSLVRGEAPTRSCAPPAMDPTAAVRRWPVRPKARAGAAAGRFAAGCRSSRLHHQRAAARPHRADRRQGVSRRRDGADGHEHRRVDLGHRQLRAQQLRQLGPVRDAAAGRVRARRHAAQDAVDAAGARGGRCRSP